MNSPVSAFAVAKALAAGLAGAPRGLLIDGVFQPAVSGRTFATTNPATGVDLCQVALGESADVDLAVAATAGAIFQAAMDIG